MTATIGSRYRVPRCSIRRISAAALIFAALPVAGCGGPGQAPHTASEPPPDIAGTVHVCSSCHGPGGHSISSTFPRLARQQKDYLIAQLKAFRDHTRADPHAKTYMWGMAGRLSNAQIVALAGYYSAQPPVSGTPDDSPEAIAGRKIYTEGIPADGVPACMACHGPKGEGNSAFPRLAGQHEGYIVRQLEAFASNARVNPIMHQNSKNLTPEEIGAVATYVHSL